MPSWAKGNKPYKGESGKKFAKRLINEQYASEQYNSGPKSDFNKLKKYGDRSFE